jgi:hypothetical protein
MGKMTVITPHEHLGYILLQIDGDGLVRVLYGFADHAVFGERIMPHPKCDLQVGVIPSLLY